MAPLAFLRLPAELRNDVYERVLTHDRTIDSKAAVALLQTCRQIQREGTGIFLTQSTFTVRASFSRTRPLPGDSSSKYHLNTLISGDTAGFSPNGVLSVADYIEAIPMKILELPQVKIELALKDEVKFGPLPFKLCRSSCRFLYALVCLLSSDGRHRRLDISANVTSSFVSEGSLVERIFWPVRFLDPHVELAVSGLGEEGQIALDHILAGRITKPRFIPSPVAELTCVQRDLRALDNAALGPTQEGLLELLQHMLHKSNKLKTPEGLWELSQDRDVRSSIAVARAVLAFLSTDKTPSRRADCRRALDVAEDIASESQDQEQVSQLSYVQMNAMRQAMG